MSSSDATMIMSYAALYYWEHRDEILAQKKTKPEISRAAAKRYYQKNREHILEQRRAYREKKKNALRTSTESPKRLEETVPVL